MNQNTDIICPSCQTVIHPTPELIDTEMTCNKCNTKILLVYLPSNVEPYNGLGAVIATIIMTLITVVLAAVLYVSVIGFKPAIYLYTPTERKERLKLTVKGIVTKRIPFTKGIRTIVWDDLTLEFGKITAKKGQYDYLFYETKNVTPKVNNKGWTFRRSAGKYYWNGTIVDEGELRTIFKGILSRYGLFDKEINDFIKYWLNTDMKINFEKNEFSYGIYPIPLPEIKRIYKIETEINYPEYIRVHFFVKNIGDTASLKEPIYPKISRSEYALHEWGIIKG